MTSCQQDAARSKKATTQAKPPTNSPALEAPSKNIITPEEKKNYFVQAKSGLNYRTEPKGEILGKFPLNTELELVARTGVFDTIRDEQSQLSGEWVAVEKDGKKVYVFDAFLAPQQLEDPTNLEEEKASSTKIIYSLDSYEIERDNSIGFIPLTDAYAYEEEAENSVIDARYLGNQGFENHHQLSPKNRRKFLQKIGIKETDQVFIYNYKLDTIYKYKVKDLILFAHLSLYATGENVSQYDYLIGFSLAEKLKIEDWTTYYDAFVYVGATNPFVRGQLEAIVWEKIDATLFPKVAPKSDVANRLKKYKASGSFKFEANQLKYYLQTYGRAAHLVVQGNEKQPVLNKVFFEGESISLAALSFIGNKNKNEHLQWTGKLFKDEAPVVFGFCYVSFGCPWIDILAKAEKSIYIRCDNRH